MGVLGTAKGQGALNGRRYLESLRDGREVWLKGERVKDVTTHPAFASVCQSLAQLYDLQWDPTTRDTMTYVEKNGLRVSYSYLLPTTPEELLLRRRNAELWVRETYGMMGRYPDFCAAIVLGFYETRDELAKIRPEFKTNIVSYHAYARDNDLCLSHALHDPAMDKSLRPEQDPDRCVRIIKERDDGVVVRGARIMSTLSPLTNEILVYPSYPLNEREGVHAVWFAIPVATPGVKLLCREPYTLGRNTFDHPLSVRFDEQDALVIFDDVLVPWERVFLMREPILAGQLFRSGVMTWAAYSSAIHLLGKLELMIGVAHLMAETTGIENQPHVLDELGEFITYKELWRTALRAAEVDYRRTPGGLIAPAPSPHMRAFITRVSERFVSIIEHISTSSLIMTPCAEDLSVPELQPYINRYFRGKGIGAAERIKLCKLAWELTCDSFGGRQQIYERLHAGDPNRIVASVYQLYDKTPGVALVKRLLKEMEGG